MAAVRSGQIILRCPITDLEYRAGVQVDEDSFRSLPDVPLAARCPFCQQPHAWRPRQARLECASAVISSELVRFSDSERERIRTCRPSSDVRLVSGAAADDSEASVDA